MRREIMVIARHDRDNYHGSDIRRELPLQMISLLCTTIDDRYSSRQVRKDRLGLPQEVSFQAPWMNELFEIVYCLCEPLLQWSHIGNLFGVSARPGLISAVLLT